jgi:hypothetical protein
MQSDPIGALVVGVVLLLLVVLSRRLCRSGKATPAATKPPRATRKPKPFAGFTRKPAPPVCEQEAGVQPSAAVPHASLRLALPELEPVPSTGVIKRWQQG